MSDERLVDARRTVRRAVQHAELEEQQRTASAARLAAERRVAALRRRTGLSRFVFENGLTLATATLFLFSFVGQVLTGHASDNDERRDHGRPTITLAEYLTTGAFVEATAENWESEFLQMGIFVVLTAFLYQRGSSESKSIEAPDAVDQRPEEMRGDSGAPWPVRRGGAALALYKHSLSLALFLLFAAAFTIHAAGGAAEYNEERRMHGGAPVSTIGYLESSRFWFESFQNWQSEFLSVGVLVLLSIWLREKGSPQSKPVGAAHSSTGG